jgi:eukaryotic-like serine/threonine-protein kinase
VNQLGKYRIVRKLATGGMAEVYLAQAEGPAGFQKQLVVKRILPHLTQDPSFVEMFLNEARLAAQLEHPNIVQIFELGEAGGSFFIAMEFIDGPNLRRLGRAIKERGQQLPFEYAAKIVALACEGLAFAHDFAPHGKPMNLIHRDISPDNIVLSRNGAVKVLDFGIAKAADQPHITKTGMVKGKLSYMPPEQLRGDELDRRADVFALGIVLYEILAGVRPFDATSDASVVQAILNQAPVPLLQRRPDTPPELIAIIDRALAKDRERRYPSCRAMQLELENFLILRSKYVSASDLASLVEMYLPRATEQQPPPLPDDAVELSVSDLEGARSPDPISLRQRKPIPVDVESVPGTKATSQAKAVLSQVARRPASRGMVLGTAAVVLVAGFIAWWFGGRGYPPPLEPAPKPVVTIAEPISASPPVAKPPAATEVAAARPTPEPAVSPPHLEATPQPAPLQPPPKSKTTARLSHKHKAEASKPPVPEPTAPSVAAHGELVVETDPPMNVTVDGLRMGTAPITVKSASTGEHDIVAFDPSKGLSKRVHVTVEAGETHKERIRFGQGTLVLRIRPWAQVEVDGKNYGVTPMAPIPIWEGEHRVKLTNSDLKKEKTLSVTVAAGEDKVVKANLEE